MAQNKEEDAAMKICRKYMPHASDKDLDQAAGNLRRYVETVMRMGERIAREGEEQGNLDSVE